MRRRAEGETGQALGEYAVLIAGIAIVCAIALFFLAGATSGWFNSSGDQQQPGGGAFTPPVHKSDLEWPKTTADCEDDGWRNYAQFKNERECKDYVRDITP
jgi:Flp pilus assembly pilin Flp